MPAIRLCGPHDVLQVVRDSDLNAAEALSSVYEGKMRGGETLDVGTWEAEAHEVPIAPYPSTELIVVLYGSFELIFPGGEETQYFGPGDAVLITQGTACGWKQTGSCRKFYAELTPPSHPPTSKL